MTTLTQPATGRFWNWALALALFTIFYNLVEGLVSAYLGAQDEALTLFGFGMDSFIEVMSGVGILAMVLRIRRHPETARSQFERTALRVTGAAFYLLAMGLGATALYNLYSGHQPTTTVPGVVIALISIAVMWLLVTGKRRVGHALDSAPILADANCTMVCIYMSLVLLVASLAHRFFGLGWIDSLGAVGLIYFSVREGREAFEKAAGLEECGCKDDSAS